MSEQVKSGWYVPDWTVPDWVGSIATTRHGGVSSPPFDSMNLGLHVDDDRQDVLHNRGHLRSQLPAEPEWIEQVHSTTCIDIDHSTERLGDAVFTSETNRVVGVLVADCLPILLAARDERKVAAIHAGWRGLAGGIIANTVSKLGSRDLVAWLGPAIGPCHYEVGADVRTRFNQELGFRRSGERWLMDLYLIARLQLEQAGIQEIHGGGFCTFCEERFYSYRRDGRTGRQGAFIWLSA